MTRARAPRARARVLCLARPHLHRDWACPGHICTRIGLTPAHRAVSHCMFMSATAVLGLDRRSAHMVNALLAFVRGLRFFEISPRLTVSTR